MKKLYISSSLLFITITSISLLNGKDFTFIPMETIGDVVRECEAVNPAFCRRGEREKACDELERILKKYYETGETPHVRGRYHGGWNILGMLSDTVNSDGAAAAVYKILEGKSSDIQAQADQEIYDLTFFLAKNSLAHPVGRTLKEWNEKPEDRLNRLAQEFKTKQNTKKEEKRREKERRNAENEKMHIRNEEFAKKREQEEAEKQAAYKIEVAKRNTKNKWHHEKRDKEYIAENSNEFKALKKQNAVTEKIKQFLPILQDECEKSQQPLWGKSDECQALELQEKLLKSSKEKDDELTLAYENTKQYKDLAEHLKSEPK